MFGFIFIVLSVFLSANEPGPAQIVRLSQKGEKIAKVLCDSQKLPAAKGTVDEIMSSIASSQACRHLSNSKRKAVAYYLLKGSIKSAAVHLDVPHGAKCPVCGMFVSKYPRWAAMMEVNGHKHYFDGVKDMMKYYIFDGDFPYDRNKINHMEVTDFYTLKAIPAKKAWFVIGSKMLGPMGHELIPFESREAARNFVNDHGGDRILRFRDITAKMVMGLDGIEYDGN
jgi:nitrous oxide reductase accessory protein NosL